MPGNALLRRLGIERRDIVERATQAADSGLWLAVRIEPTVTFGQLAPFLDRWNQAGLASITDVAVPSEWATGSGDCPALSDERFAWFAEMAELSSGTGVYPLVPAAAKGAERLCGDIRDVQVGLDEATPVNFTGPCFLARAEREKSFVRCAKALLKGVTDSRVDRVSLWTNTPRVVASCRSAARDFGLDPGDRYGFCLPETATTLAASLLRDGESVRMWWAVDRSVIERAVGQ